MYFMKSNYIFFALFAFLLASCDGFQAIDGLIIDAETHLPISDVPLKELKKNDTLEISDEQGYFEIHQVKGFPIGDKELTVVLSKKGYIQDTVTFINNEHKLIKLEKIK